MAVQTRDLPKVATEQVTAARKATEATAPKVQASDPKHQSSAGSETHWMDGVALWVWVFGIGSLALVNLIDMVKSLFSR
jgi:hypothetical protein